MNLSMEYQLFDSQFAEIDENLTELIEVLQTEVDLLSSLDTPEADEKLISFTTLLQSSQNTLLKITEYYNTVKDSKEKYIFIVTEGVTGGIYSEYYEASNKVYDVFYLFSEGFYTMQDTIKAANLTGKLYQELVTLAVSKYAEFGLSCVQTQIELSNAISHAELSKQLKEQEVISAARRTKRIEILEADMLLDLEQASILNEQKSLIEATNKLITDEAVASSELEKLEHDYLVQKAAKVNNLRILSQNRKSLNEKHKVRMAELTARVTLAEEKSLQLKQKAKSSAQEINKERELNDSLRIKLENSNAI